MKGLIPLLAIMLIISACTETITPLTQQEIAREKEQIIKTIKDFNKAFEQKDFSGILPTLSDDVIFFGTDSAEVINSLTDFKKKITDQFNAVSKLNYGELTDVSVQIDKYGTFATIIYGLPATVEQEGKIQHLYLRASRTLKKEDDKWLIVSGIIGVAGGTGNLPQDTLTK
jgi:ketosteroid isomerase-like protein